MKPFTSIIFYGACGKDCGFYTEQQMEELNRQIQKIQEINGGLQQPCHCETEDQHKICEEERKHWTEVKRILGESIKKALDI